LIGEAADLYDSPAQIARVTRHIVDVHGASFRRKPEDSILPEAMLRSPLVE
jgi:hypothetical protein